MKAIATGVPSTIIALATLWRVLRVERQATPSNGTNLATIVEATAAKVDDTATKVDETRDDVRDLKADFRDHKGTPAHHAHRDS